MPMEDRIVYDADRLVSSVESSLDLLKCFQYDSRYRALLGDSFIAKLTDWDRQIRARKHDPFTLVVCGDFKRGKSSIINALLGEEVVTTNVTAETVTLNRISYGSHSNEAMLSGGKKMLLEDEELQRDRLQVIMEQTKETVTQIHIQRPLDFLKDITIIDTPGLGDAFKDFSSLVGDALAQADAVIYVFSVSYPLSQQEQMFLKTAVLPQRYTDLFLVGNFADTMPDRAGLERMKVLIQKRIQDLLPGERAYFVSALDERCLQLGSERPNEALSDVLADNFMELRQALDRLVSDKRSYILPNRMERLLGMMRNDLEGSLTAMERGLSMDEAGIRAEKDKLNAERARQAQIQVDTKKRISSKVRDMKEEAMAWMGELVDRMEAEIDGLRETDAAALTKYYSFYCVDLLQQGMERCAALHQDELYDALEEISLGLAKGLSEGQVQTPYSFRFALDNKTWTKGDNVSYVISKVDSSGILNLLADGFVLGGIRQRELAGRTSDILASIHKQYADVRSSVVKMIERDYSRMEQLAEKQIQIYYCDRLAGTQAQVEQSAAVARQNEETKKKIEVAMREVREALTKAGVY